MYRMQWELLLVKELHLEKHTLLQVRTLNLQRPLARICIKNFPLLLLNSEWEIVTQQVYTMAEEDGIN